MRDARGLPDGSFPGQIGSSVATTDDRHVLMAALVGASSQVALLRGLATAVIHRLINPGQLAAGTGGSRPIVEPTASRTAS